MRSRVFKDRKEAGRELAKALWEMRGQDLVVLGIPRGGVVVAEEVAKSLHAPLDIVVTRKIEAPGEPEYALGAVTQEGEVIVDKQAAESLGASTEYLESQIATKKKEVEERKRNFKGAAGFLPLEGKSVLIVDDGIATGSSMAAAVMSVKRKNPKSITVAVPVAPEGAMETLSEERVKIVSLQTPKSFLAIGEFYEDFRQVDDDEVKEILARTASRESQSSDLN